jgi:hypothetical protein
MTRASQPGKNPGKKNPTTTATPAQFESFLDEAQRARVDVARDMPLVADIEPRALLRYAAGRVSQDERAEVEQFLGTRSTWGYERVVALVRAARPETKKTLAGSLARRLLDAKERPALVTVAAAVLEAEGDAPGAEAKFDEAWRGIEKNGSPRARIACLLGLGRLDDAKTLLEKASPADPVTTLLRRVTAAHRHDPAADDAPLLALLDVFPTIFATKIGENEPTGAKKKK